MSGRLFCFYGDDFTGSTDALEALAANGVPTVLFLDPPPAELLSKFPDNQAIGIAGESRSRSPEWMSEHLPAIFQVLRRYGAPICQYKVCSTFDSSSQTGNIGRALEIGKEVFEAPWVPIVVAAPHLGRYVLFGNLFAAGGGAIHRIDRHPTMRQHPVTPMHESDLRLHLAQQTDRSIALLDVIALRNRSAGHRLDALLHEHPDAVLFDGLDEQTLEETGRLIGTRCSGFAVGSAGLTHAMIHYWREISAIPREFVVPSAGNVDRLLVVSGSCSPVTERQIRKASESGFDTLRFDAIGASLEHAIAALSSGRSLVIYTALGPGDRTADTGGDVLGRNLGVVTRKLLAATGVRRVVIAGGDTSTHAVRQLGIYALTFAGCTTPGAPLCRSHSGSPNTDGLELVLKGGQVGPEDYFEQVRQGTR
jgi:3-oxoisoapionate kinase